MDKRNPDDPAAPAPPPAAGDAGRAGGLFCLGLGYTALRLAGSLRADGWSVAGVCRTAARRDELRRTGVAAFRFGADPGERLARATALLCSVPPDADGDPALRRYRDEIAASSRLRWVGYLSSTGVYGDRGGAWVGEDSAAAPTGPRARRRLDAECAWRALLASDGVPVHVFRLAGIYGPGRNALDRVRSGEARRIVKPGHVFSRIHVDDVVAVLRASMRRPNPGAVYNVCDDEPAPGADVTAFAAALLGAPPPPGIPFDRARLSPQALRFYADDRRVRNDRIKRELGVRLRYPDYRTGLRALLEE